MNSNWKHKNFNNFFKFFVFESLDQKADFIGSVIQLPHNADTSLDINSIEEQKVKVKIKSVYDRSAVYERLANKIDEVYYDVLSDQTILLKQHIKRCEYEKDGN